MLILFRRDEGISGGLQFNLPLVPINICCFLPCFKAQMKFIEGEEGTGAVEREGMWRGKHHLQDVNVKKMKTDARRGKGKLVGTRRGRSAFSPGDAAHILGTARGRWLPAASSRGEARGQERQGGNGPAPQPGPWRRQRPVPSPGSPGGKCLPLGEQESALALLPRPEARRGSALRGQGAAARAAAAAGRERRGRCRG